VTPLGHDQISIEDTTFNRILYQAVLLEERGKERERLDLKPVEGRWKISGEQELQIYWLLRNNTPVYPH